MLVIPVFLDHIKNRLHEFIKEWATDINSAFLSYLHTKMLTDDEQGKGEASFNHLPFWYHLPGWLTKLCIKESGDQEILLEFLKDVLWAQYCLFCFIRIQDDVYDGQADNPSFLFYGNQFLLETERMLARHFEVSHQLWLLYHNLVIQTSRGIVECNELQTSIKTPPEDLLTTYQDAGAIFNLGAAAVCCKCSRMDIYPKITEFTADMTVAGQIMDDIADIQEDLKSEKYNFAANILLRQENQGEILCEDAADVIGRSILYHGMDKVLQPIQDRLSHAHHIMGNMNLPEAAEMIQRYQRGIEAQKDELRQSRVDIFFGNHTAFDFP